jgi:hypothetical protein
MQIPDRIRKCVAFLTCEISGQTTWRGTTFFIAEKLDDLEDATAEYAVTSAHVIRNIKKNVSGGVMRLQFNTREHGRKSVEMRASDWTIHDDPCTDIAICPID